MVVSLGYGLLLVLDCCPLSVNGVGRCVYCGFGCVLLWAIMLCITFGLELGVFWCLGVVVFIIVMFVFVILLIKFGFVWCV